MKYLDFNFILHFLFLVLYFKVIIYLLLYFIYINYYILKGWIFYLNLKSGYL